MKQIESAESRARSKSSIKNSVLHGAFIASLFPTWRRFEFGLRHPERMNSQRLHRILKPNIETEFGKAHQFQCVDSIADFQSRVPIRTFEEMNSYIQRSAEGRPGVLTAADVVAFERTSGTTAVETSLNQTKLIPFTGRFREEMGLSLAAWLADVHFQIPSLIGKKSYYALSPEFAREKLVTRGGIPIGLSSELDWFGPLGKRALERLAIVPRLPKNQNQTRTHLDKAEASHQHEVLHEWRLQTAASLLSARDLGLISIWSPTFLFPIFDTFIRHWEDVMDRVVDSNRKSQLQSIRARHELPSQMPSFLNRVWPELRIVSAWSDGSSTDVAHQLELILPDRAHIESKGLIATEGIVTVPFNGSPDPVTAIGSHFLEFIDLERPTTRARLPHELKIGGLYSPVITTSAGLYRYNIRDVLYCTGRNRNSPTLRYRGRLDKTSNVCGEKLDSAQVERAYEIACSFTGFRPGFFLLSTEGGSESGGDSRNDFAHQLAESKSYRVFLETSKSSHEILKFVDAFERALLKNERYAHAVSSELILPMAVTLIERGIATWSDHLIREGHRVRDLKLSRLDTRYNWRKVFARVTKRDLIRDVVRIRTSDQGSNRGIEAAIPVIP